MGRLTESRCRFLQEKLIESGIPPGSHIPRRIWDETLVRSLGIGKRQAQNLTEDGELNGFWTRHAQKLDARDGLNKGSKAGSIELRELRASD